MKTIIPLRKIQPKNCNHIHHNTQTMKAAAHHQTCEINEPRPTVIDSPVNLTCQQRAKQVALRHRHLYHQSRTPRKSVQTIAQGSLAEDARVALIAVPLLERKHTHTLSMRERE
ncbi:hypothetical protein RP20_CCG026609 [Aedes albopictus]|nr:hypothetical protein RP20_CCG026609 [Aedes albopictus]